MLISRFLEALKAQNLRFWVSLGKNLKYSSPKFFMSSVLLLFTLSKVMSRNTEDTKVSLFDSKMTNGNPVLAAQRNFQPRRTLFVIRKVTWSLLLQSLLIQVSCLPWVARVADWRKLTACSLPHPTPCCLLKKTPTSRQCVRVTDWHKLTGFSLPTPTSQPPSLSMSFISSPDLLRMVFPQTCRKEISESETCGMKGFFR